jgi:hypothetical protein
MGRRLESTPRSKVRQALRQLWLRSRERQAALKRDKYTCQVPGCNKKQSRAKGKEIYVEVHHKEGIENWDKLIDTVFEYLLCHPDKLETMCVECHEKLKEIK